MIDIIIPAYNAHNTIERTLFSIAYQVCIEKINVYIVNDASDKDYQEYVSFFSKFMNIQELTLDENKGPGYARGYGVNQSSSEYILFIDSDDLLYDCFSVKRLYDEIKNTNVDVVIGNFIEELDCSTFPHEKDTIWLHGKMYRRNFLIENDINFNDSRLNEDNGFNQLIFLGSSKIKFLDFNVYIWCNNKNSITRKGGYKEFYELLLGYIYNISWALSLAHERNYDKNKIAELSYAALVAIYCHYLNLNHKLDCTRVLIDSRKIKDISDKYILTEDKKLDILNTQYITLLDNETRKYLLDPEITFSTFLKLIEGEL